VVHFIEHGAVVETGKTVDGTACKQLRERTLTYKTVKHPLTQKEIKVVTGGFFRDLWDSAHPDGASKPADSDKDAQIKQLEADLSEAREAKKRVTERLVLTRWSQAYSAAMDAKDTAQEQPTSPGLSQMLLMSMGIDGVASPPEFESGFQAHAKRAYTK